MTKSPKRPASRRPAKKAKTIDMKAEPASGKAAEKATDKAAKEAPKKPDAAQTASTGKDKPEVSAATQEAKAATASPRKGDTTSAWRGKGTPPETTDAADSTDTKADAPKADAKAKTPAGKPTSRPPAAKGGTGGRIAAGIVGGIIALGGAVGLHYGGVLPLGSANEPSVSTQELQAINQAIETRLTELDSRIDALPSPPDEAAINDAVDQRLNAMQPATDEATLSRIAQLEASAAALEQQLAAARQEVEALQQQQAASSETGDAATDAQRLAAVSDKVDILAGDFARLKQDVSGAVVDPKQVAEIGTKVATVESRIGELENSLGSVADRITALPQEVASADALKTATAGISEQLSGQISGISETLGAVQQSVTDQGERLSAIESKLADGADKRAARALIAAQLKSRLDRGLPFAQVLETYRKATGDEAAFADIAGAAETGIPTTDALLASFRPAARAVRNALAPVEDMSISDRLLSSARNLVKIRPIDAPDGDSPDALLTRTQAALESGDAAAALTAWSGLPDAGRAAAADFTDALTLRATAEARIASALDSLIADTIAN